MSYFGYPNMYPPGFGGAPATPVVFIPGNPNPQPLDNAHSFKEAYKFMKKWEKQNNGLKPPEKKEDKKDKLADQFSKASLILIMGLLSPFIGVGVGSLYLSAIRSLGMLVRTATGN